jgi:HEAT repeat protein
VEALLARVRSAEATPAECAARVPDLASAALDERDPRRGAAIAALGLAGTAESREALLRIVETGPLADAALAERALAGAVRAPEGF